MKIEQIQAVSPIIFNAKPFYIILDSTAQVIYTGWMNHLIETEAQFYHQVKQP